MSYGKDWPYRSAKEARTSRAAIREGFKKLLAEIE